MFAHLLDKDGFDPLSNPISYAFNISYLILGSYSFLHKSREHAIIEHNLKNSSLVDPPYWSSIKYASLSLSLSFCHSL